MKRETYQERLKRAEEGGFFIGDTHAVRYKACKEAGIRAGSPFQVACPYCKANVNEECRVSR